MSDPTTRNSMPRRGQGSSRRHSSALRYQLIVGTYLRRPLLWAILAGVLWFGVMGWMTSVRQNLVIAYPEWPTMRARIDFPLDLESVRAAGRQGEVEGIMLGHLVKLPQNNGPSGQAPSFTPPGEDFYQILDEFPNLHAVQYYCWDARMAGLDKVLRLPELEHLQLEGACQFDVARLAQANKLRSLNLRTYQPPQDVAALARLPQLETIVFETRQAVDDATLAELAKLPQLKTLVIDVPKSHSMDKPLTQAGLAALAASQSLERLYVGGWQPEAMAEYLPLARAALPGFEVRPSRTHVSPLPPDFFRVMPFFGLGALLGLQLSSQLRSPLRRLAPRFTRDHAIVAGTLAGAAVLGCAVRLVVNGAVPTAALAVSALVVVLAMAGTASSSLATTTTFQLLGVNRLLHMLTFIGFGLMVVLYIPEWSDYMLRRGDWRVLAALTTAAIGSFAVLVWLLSQLVFWGTAATPLPTMPGRGWFNRTMAYRDTWQFAGAAREGRIEALPLTPAGAYTWWRRVTRWRLANMPLRILRLTIVMFLFFAGFQWLGIRSLPNAQAAVRGMLPIAVMFVVSQIGMQVGVLWRTRLSTLALESTRPCSRRALRYEWMAAFTVDLVPAVVIVGALAAVGLNWDPPWQVRWQDVPRSFLLITPAGLPLVAALAAVVAIIERPWLMFLLVMGLIMAAPMAIVAAMFACYMAIGAEPPSPKDLPVAFQSYAWGAGLLGAIVCAILARRFFTMEVGRRT